MSRSADARILKARGLRASRGGRTVIDGVDLDVERGEVVAVTGPNGSGKSTFLELLALLREPDGGELELAGERARFRDSKQRRRVTLAMQPAYLLRGTVLESVRFGLRAHRLPRAECTSRAKRALEEVGLDALAGRSVEGLSAGERQRVNLARAISLPVDLLLFDEPTTNLDPEGAQLVVQCLRSRQSDGSVGIVIATPGDRELLALADRTLDLASSVEAAAS